MNSSKRSHGTSGFCDGNVHSRNMACSLSPHLWLMLTVKYFMDNEILSNLYTRDPREQSSWGQHGAHLGPVGPRWAPCWPNESAIRDWLQIFRFKHTYGKQIHIRHIWIIIPCENDSIKIKRAILRKEYPCPLSHTTNELKGLSDILRDNR